MGSDSGELVILGLAEFKGDPLTQMFDRNNYNPYRITKENHNEGFRRYKPMISRKGELSNINIKRDLRVHRYKVEGVLRYGILLITVDIEGNIRLTN